VRYSYVLKRCLKIYEEGVRRLIKMIIETKFLNKLKEFGLNSYEAKIWTALLSRGVSSAGELSDISNVPRSRAYDVLESLEKKGFIVMKIGKPIKYIAVKPEEVLERVKQKVHDDADKQVDLLDELKKDEVLQELDTLYTQGVEVIEPSDLTGALRDRQNYYNNLNLMINGAEKEVVLVTTAKGLSRKADALKRSLDKAKKRGISIRVVAPLTKDSKKAAEQLSKVAEVKHSDDVKSRFCIVDGKEIAFSLLDDDKAIPAYDVGVWVNSGFFATALMQMFENIWQNT
jgi:HTH-type transcriptional regulator, sugar sensing transcriptional regulator